MEGVPCISKRNLKEHYSMGQKVKVKMNVQTMYKSELLRAGNVYEVGEETAERWIISGLADEVTDE